MIEREILSPNPVPLPTDFVVKNGFNILSRASFGIPFPESVILIIHAYALDWP